MENLLNVELSQTVQTDYLEYSIATLARALPDVYDSLIPARRRVLQTMLEESLLPTKPYVKCARTTGLTSAFYHPHGSAYGSLISMATPWNNTIPWVDVHGNIGSTVDPPAAERYLENRLTTAALEIMLQNKETWETRPNYDGSRKEAIRLDARIPAILLNGTEGISVGYNTRIPQHNLSEICDAVVNGTTLTPDFPTSCYIINDDGLDNYKRTGSGTLRLRACSAIEEKEKVGRSKARVAFTFTCLPPNTNPEKIGSQIKEGLEKGKLEGIAEVIDLTDMSGDRIQVVAKPGTNTETLLQTLFQYTDLESTYFARNMCLKGATPIELPSSEIIQEWKKWRIDRLSVIFSHEQDAKLGRLEIVIGLLKAIDKLDAVIKVIRAAASPKEALIELVSNRNLKFTADQARAILEMKLRSLTNLDAEELATEKSNLEQRLTELNTLINNETARTDYMLKEVKAIGKKFGYGRRSCLIDVPAEVIAGKSAIRTAAPAKPRFLKIDKAKGIVTQEKGPRGALVLEPTDKLITLTQDGTLKKVAANYKGTLSDRFSPVLLAKKETDVVSRKYLLVFSLENTLKALVIPGEELARVTSKGKAILPEEAQIIHFGEENYVVNWVSSRKKPLTLDLTVKPGKPGGKGIKIASLSEVATGV